MTKPVSFNLKLSPLPRPLGMPPNDAQAMARVVDPRPAPRICPHCCCAVSLVDNRAIYGQPQGSWPWVYLCSNRTCAAFVEVHPGTDFAVGGLATAVVRVARKRVKDLFNPLWQTGRLSRSDAYRELAHEMSIPTADCHFSLFDAAMCRRAALAAMHLQVQLRG